MSITATPNLDQRVQDLIAENPTKLLIGGDWVEAADGQTFETIDPSSGQVITSCASAGPEDVERAVRAAEGALAEWQGITPADRGKVLWRVAELIERDAEAIAQLEVLDMGKPLALARDDDMPMAAEHFRYFAGWTTKLEGNTIPVSAGSYLNYTLREPLGVVGLIVPWNYPFMLAAWKLAPALATGNCCILKPAEQTPLTSIWMGRLLQEAGIPDGVVSVLTGYGETAGAAITNHDRVAAVSFTGSTAVGREIVHASAGNLKRVALELGGKSPNVIFADADLAEVAASAIAAVFANSGQDCCARSRIIVERPVLGEFVELMSGMAGKVRQGDPLDPDVKLGSLISAGQKDRVLGFIDRAVADGAEVVCGGQVVDLPGLEAGNAVSPTIITGAAPDSEVATTEVFGPVATVLPFDGEAEAIALANGTRYGLSGSLWTRDIGRAIRVGREIRSGLLSINSDSSSYIQAPFGGYRQSGLGKEQGLDGLYDFTEVKNIYVSDR